MTTTIQATNLIGTGVQFTFAAAGDSFAIVQGVTVGSTTGTAIIFGLSANLSLDIGGTLISTSLSSLSTNISITIGSNGRYTCLQAGSANAAVNLGGDTSRLDNAGDLVSARSIGVLSAGGNDVVNSGRIVAASGVFLGLAGQAGDTLVNMGQITANRYDDAARDARYNNGVFAEGAATRITNLADGVITASGAEGAGVRFGAGANGSSVINDGVITAATWYGVDFNAMGVAESARLENTGTIRGVQGAFNGNDTADFVVNRGLMVGLIVLGGGGDFFNGQGGRTESAIFAGGGSDVIDLRGAALVDDYVYGGVGFDTIRGSGWDEAFFGDEDGDALYGNGGDDAIYGGLGADRLFGGAGNDLIFDISGQDALFGGDGDDVLNGAVGDTRAYGGAGDDHLVIGTGVAAQFVDGRGGAGDDTVDGGGGADSIFGGAGDDVINTLLGNDTVDGGDGADRLVLSDGADLGSGGQGDDVISGGGGADTLNGGAGNDTINGGLLRDQLAGGAGADVFVFTSRTHTGLTSTTADVISDMRAGTDLIDLSAMDARGNVAGNQAFSYVGTASLTGASGRLRYDAATGLVQGDVTGDGVADFAILVQNRAALAALDFVL